MFILRIIKLNYFETSNDISFNYNRGESIQQNSTHRSLNKTFSKLKNIDLPVAYLEKDRLR